MAARGVSDATDRRVARVYRFGGRADGAAVAAPTVNIINPQSNVTVEIVNIEGNENSTTLKKQRTPQVCRILNGDGIGKVYKIFMLDAHYGYRLVTPPTGYGQNGTVTTIIVTFSVSIVKGESSAQQIYNQIL